MTMLIRIALSVVALVTVGVAIGRHFGALDGIAASLALYLLTPWEPNP